MKKLRNTTLACRSITQKLSAEEKEKYLLLKLEDLEAKKAYGDLVQLLFRQFKAKESLSSQQRLALPFAYLRLLQDKLTREGSPSLAFRMNLFIALKMFNKGSGLISIEFQKKSSNTIGNLGSMISVISPQFRSHLGFGPDENDRDFFFEECLRVKLGTQDPLEQIAIEEFVSMVLGSTDSENLRTSLMKFDPQGAHFRAPWSTEKERKRVHFLNKTFRFVYEPTETQRIGLVIHNSLSLPCDLGGDKYKDHVNFFFTFPPFPSFTFVLHPDE